MTLVLYDGSISLKSSGGSVGIGSPPYGQIPPFIPISAWVWDMPQVGGLVVIYCATCFCHYQVFLAGKASIGIAGLTGCMANLLR